MEKVKMVGRGQKMCELCKPERRKEGNAKDRERKNSWMKRSEGIYVRKESFERK